MSKTLKNEVSNEILSKKYQKKTDREHILDAPDTYIGSIEKDKEEGWIFHKDIKMEYRPYEMIPGFYKCFDEGIVNARDHYIRMNTQIETDKTKSPDKKNYPVTSIQVTIDKETGMISIYNDGNGIDVIKHPEHDIWIPEMIFGHLRTSTNYDKNEKKIVGGKNGFGFKLVLIYSSWGKIETIDHERGLKYVQEFKENLSVIEKPKITKSKAKPYTRVSWIPDYKRFQMNGITDDMENILIKRIYDIAGVTDSSIKVKYNDVSCGIKSFEQYVNLYVGDKTATKRIYEKSNERWEYAVCVSPFDEFRQVSFVNGIHTSKGGKHVEYILQQLTKKIVEYIEKKKKVKVKSSTIKEQLMIFVNCVIENPSFDSQTKDTLNTSSTKFGSTCKISDKFVEKVAKLGIMEQAISLHQVKENKDTKKTDGKKTKTIYGIPKLIDANYAGTSKSSECVLILCEGDSAKSGIVSGLSKEDRNTIGVYPLKGKLMNIRDVTKGKIHENKEIVDIKKIMGLESNKVYKHKEDIKKSLRYGKILILTDQDLDGVHIKGLCLNMFDCEWGSLVKEDNFIGFMNTPILKVKKGTTEKSFYNEQDYTTWKQQNNDGKGWTTKYYKGLGTSTSKEFKEYFKNKKYIYFQYNEDTPNALDKVFRKTRSEDRKGWLKEYNKNEVLNVKKNQITHSEFIDKEFIHFSKYDCERSIPNIMDGLKTSLRKILYCAFKRNLTKEIKVAQFGGYVSEHSGYHHGEMSLMQSIVGMAQDFVGSNNINILQPNGQFGTRLQGGTDSASERYIFTQLASITRYIYRKEDDPILNYLYDDGDKVEPEFYVPIIPMILVNGSIGIGTGFSTNIPCYNPIQIIDYLTSKLLTEKVLNSNTTSNVVTIQNNNYDDELMLWYRGFKGEIFKFDNHIYIIKGKYMIVDEKKEIIHITELPVGTWIENYKIYIEKCMNQSGNKKTNIFIKEYSDQSTDTNVDITITLVKGTIQKYINKKGEYGCNGLDKLLQMYNVKRTTNMHMFDDKQQLKKYTEPEMMIDTYIDVRKLYYSKRKNYQLEHLKREVVLLSNKARFILEQCNDTLDLRKKKKDVVIDLLKKKKYDIIDGDKEYKYLRSMPIDSVIEENVNELLKQKEGKESEYNELKNTTEIDIWLNELEELKTELKKNKLYN